MNFNVNANVRALIHVEFFDDSMYFVRRVGVRVCVFVFKSELNISISKLGFFRHFRSLN